MDSQIRPFAGYRVIARHRDQSNSLVSLAENPRHAAIVAKAFCEAHGSRNGIIWVRTEEWVGNGQSC